MSDLAAFVAATIESKVVKDLKEENDKLQAENDRLRTEINKTRASALQNAKRSGCIEIKAQGGSPVYAHGLLSSAHFQDYNEDSGILEFYLNFTPNSIGNGNTQVMCPMSKVLDAEIHVNGIKITTVKEYYDCDSYENSRVGNETYQNECCNYNTGCGTHWEKLTLDISFSPALPSDDWRLIFSEDIRDEEIDKLVFKGIVIGIKGGDGNEDDVLLQNI